MNHRAKLGFRFDLLVEPPPIRICAFQSVLLEELRPQVDPRVVENVQLPLRQCIVNRCANDLDDLQLHNSSRRDWLKRKEMRETLMRNRSA
jgi:hypothetical protein